VYDYAARGINCRENDIFQAEPTVRWALIFALFSGARLKPEAEPCREPQDVQALDDCSGSRGDDPESQAGLFEQLLQMRSEIFVDLVDLSVLAQMNVE
jgi:hypothetical protein